MELLFGKMWCELWRVREDIMTNIAEGHDELCLLVNSFQECTDEYFSNRPGCS